ncbi:hypothetical protein B5F90_04225 [Alistipes sp. An31A]|uniref:hypothetical protein n=1 Tax=Alistipes sp. An31A TaxID=1965631 RepID=UPI000B3803D8|nr:hypothetical protein [Alistipes sp. An31A]OUO22102.1 hypothetical protein B5F90_04225 [Alistipes sp. An31A]
MKSEKPETNTLSEQEAFELIARVFDRNMRRMNFVSGELFIAWGALAALTALAEYALLRWTGTPQVLWSAIIPFTACYLFTVGRNRRKGIVRTGFDDLLLLVWGFPAMTALASVAYAVITPENTVNPAGIVQLLFSGALMVTSEFFRGKGSNQSGSFAALVGLGMAGFIATFTFTFRTPFDLISGEWLLQLALWCTLLVMLPGFILRHIARKPCSRS